jgi:hypothetical protein
MTMLLLYAVLVLSVVVLVGVTVAVFVRVRKKIGALPIEEPAEQSIVEVSREPQP